jgi:hypothetical protein
VFAKSSLCTGTKLDSHITASANAAYIAEHPTSESLDFGHTILWDKANPFAPRGKGSCPPYRGSSGQSDDDSGTSKRGQESESEEENKENEGVEESDDEMIGKRRKKAIPEPSRRHPSRHASAAAKDLKDHGSSQGAAHKHSNIHCSIHGGCQGSQYSIPPYKRWGLLAELTCSLTGFHRLWDKILSQSLQAVTDHRCHLEGSSPNKWTAYREVHCNTVSVESL